jgi:hypothetical protein
MACSSHPSLERINARMRSNNPIISRLQPQPCCRYYATLGAVISICSLPLINDLCG